MLFTPEGGTQSSLASNITTTDVSVTYGLSVSHSVSPSTFTVGDTLNYTVLAENTGTGQLFNPFVSVTASGGTLDFVEGSETAFLYAGGALTPVALTVAGTDPLTFATNTVMPAGSILYINYQSTVTAADAGEIVSTATVGANEGSETGVTISDSDIATVTRTLLSIVKTAPESASVGDTINYQFTITNTSAGGVVLNALNDQLPVGFAFSGVTLTVGGVAVPLVEGTDYTVSDTGLFLFDPAATVTLPAGEAAVLTISGVLTA